MKPWPSFLRSAHTNDICRRSPLGFSLWQLGRKGQSLRVGRDFRTPSRFQRSEKNGGTIHHGYGSSFTDFTAGLLPNLRNRIRTYIPGQTPERRRRPGSGGVQCPFPRFDHSKTKLRRHVCGLHLLPGREQAADFVSLSSGSARRSAASYPRPA